MYCAFYIENCCCIYSRVLLTIIIKKKDEFAENVAKFMDVTMGGPIMAPFQTWGIGI